MFEGHHRKSSLVSDCNLSWEFKALNLSLFFCKSPNTFQAALSPHCPWDCHQLLSLPLQPSLCWHEGQVQQTFGPPRHWVNRNFFIFSHNKSRNTNFPFPRAGASTAFKPREEPEQSHNPILESLFSGTTHRTSTMRSMRKIDPTSGISTG